MFCNPPVIISKVKAIGRRNVSGHQQMRLLMTGQAQPLLLVDRETDNPGRQEFSPISLFPWITGFPELRPTLGRHLPSNQ